jgi:glycosyltransferase involved in cell wall biosynthesis
MGQNTPATAALIIPALNEEPVIGSTLRTVPPDLFSAIIVADNGSTDRTAEVARTAGAVVVREPKRGYGSACLAALREVPAGTTAVVFMQADGSEDPAEAVRLLAPIYSGRADLVIGSRTLGRPERGALTLPQVTGNYVATVLMRWLYGHTFTDLGPFRAIRLDVLGNLGMSEPAYGWTVEMQVRALKNGLRVEEIPVSYRKRRAGTNKISGNLVNSVRAGVGILWTVLKLRAS